MLTILLGVYGFKLLNMEANKKDSGRIGRIVWITQFFLCGQIFVVPHQIMQFERILFFGGLLYKQCQTPDLLISVLYIVAKPKRIEMMLQTIK